MNSSGKLLTVLLGALVIVTLLVAVLFNPLRRWLQTLIDQRFYRSRYDATRTLDTFAATLRTELDLADLSAHLSDVVQETMHPAHMSLWLRSQRHTPLRKAPLTITKQGTGTP